jgi:hypothetical protein
MRSPAPLLAAGAALALAAAAAVVPRLRAADHRDSAVLTDNPAQDIADVYSFRSPADPSRVVLAMTVSGLTPPAEATTTYFDPTILYQFKIDTNGDAVEDRVIQAYVTGTGAEQRVHFRGPVAPPATGTTTRLADVDDAAVVQISTDATARTASGDGLTVFAGVRDDPFFFDLAQFRAIVGGQATAFNDPGTDAFAGTNVLAFVVELPAAALGAASVGVWGTTSRFTE